MLFKPRMLLKWLVVAVLTLAIQFYEGVGVGILLYLKAPAVTKDARPTGLRLVMIGDSVTRYQYLSLAYFLRYGYWVDPHQVTENLVHEKSFEGGWEQFYTETTKLLSPLEKCDCYREEWPNKFEVDEHVVENRYFFDPALNNTLVYLQAYGNKRSARLHGRIFPQDAFRDTQLFEYNHRKTDWLWNIKDWGEAIEQYVSRLNATHVLMNAGLWPTDFDRNKDARDSLFQALNKTGLVGIWRTTTFENDHKQYEGGRRTDAVMPRLFGAEHVLDVSWTKQLDEKFYWDRIHFYEPAYRVLNEELLGMIGHEFPRGYEWQDMRELLDTSIAY